MSSIYHSGGHCGKPRKSINPVAARRGGGGQRMAYPRSSAWASHLGDAGHGVRFPAPETDGCKPGAASVGMVGRVLNLTGRRSCFGWFGRIVCREPLNFRGQGFVTPSKWAKNGSSHW
jgi:hypothetical protein